MGEAKGFCGLVQVDVAGEARIEKEVAEKEGITRRGLAWSIGYWE